MSLKVHLLRLALCVALLTINGCVLFTTSFDRTFPATSKLVGDVQQYRVGDHHVISDASHLTPLGSRLKLFGFNAPKYALSKGPSEADSPEDVDLPAQTEIVVERIGNIDFIPPLYIACGKSASKGKCAVARISSGPHKGETMILEVGDRN